MRHGEAKWNVFNGKQQQQLTYIIRFHMHPQSMHSTAHSHSHSHASTIHANWNTCATLTKKLNKKNRERETTICTPCAWNNIEPRTHTRNRIKNEFYSMMVFIRHNLLCFHSYVVRFSSLRCETSLPLSLRRSHDARLSDETSSA